MRELKFSPKIFSSYVLESIFPNPEDRKNFEGIRYTYPVNSSDGTELNVKLEKALASRQREGQQSTINALFAYDALDLLGKGSEKCFGSENIECLHDYFLKLGVQEGVSGKMTFQNSGALERPYGLKVVKNGEFVWLQK